MPLIMWHPSGAIGFSCRIEGLDGVDEGYETEFETGSSAASLHACAAPGLLVVSGADPAVFAELKTVLDYVVPDSVAGGIGGGDFSVGGVLALLVDDFD